MGTSGTRKGRRAPTRAERRARHRAAKAALQATWEAVQELRTQRNQGVPQHSPEAAALREAERVAAARMELALIESELAAMDLGQRVARVGLADTKWPRATPTHLDLLGGLTLLPPVGGLVCEPVGPW